ncbi:hypothetical protein TrST_g8705 [Triparma strigata]|uniref:Uncharacterized protein n=1 Tax=Triparma strigata TaxID=1606541 RepID=A0A9W6ZJP7_9STRA|nr:hypothetical protein TrST_g8705 [Triparma strigata]
MAEYANRENKKIKWFTDWEKSDVPADLSSKTYAVTGTTSGTGLIFCRTVANRGATVYMLNRDSERAEKALELVKAGAKDPEKVFHISCDLQDFSSVKEAAAQLTKACPDGLDVLVNNAGVMCHPNSQTKDGYSSELQVNHLSHFLLTAEVWGLLEKKADETGDARVVNHTSGASQLVFMTAFFGFKRGVNPRYFEKDMKRVGGDGFVGRMQRYGQTKFANVVFSHALATKQSKVKSLVAHPGVCTTPLTNHHSDSQSPFMTRMFKKGFDKGEQSCEDGTMGILACACLATAGSGELHGPKSFNFDGLPAKSDIKNTAMGTWFSQKPEVSVEKLWEVSKKATGAIFPFE